MRNIKILMFSKLLVLIGAIILTCFLILIGPSKTTTEQSTVIILDVQTGMLKQDISVTKGDVITRLDAAKKIITKIISAFPQRSFGLLTYGSEITYLIPPTSDSWILLQYVNSLLTESNVESWTTNTRGVEGWGLDKRDDWLLTALKDKNIITIWNIELPKSLLDKSQIIPLDSYATFDPTNLSTSQPLLSWKDNVSTTQTQLLIILLCLLIVLSL